MIDIRALEKNEENPFLKTTFVEGYRRSLNDRGMNGDEIINGLLEANKQRKALINESETVKAKQNKISAEIPKLKREGKDTADLMRESQKLGEELKAMDARTAEADEKVTQRLLELPNILHHSVPKGAGAEDNRIEKTVGEPTKLKFKALEHWELGEKHGNIDFERAGKVTGARFAFLLKGAARVERALIQFMMDLHSDKHGYTEMIPPFMANAKSFVGVGQFPKFKGDVFALNVSPEYYLIPTAEVPVTNYFAEEILDAEMLPRSFVAYSPCFRSEAGSHGRDTKGLIRQHQFNKVELVKFTRPEESEKAHEELTTHAEAVLEQLELPYRRMTLCSRDISFGAMKCHDLEVWLPGQNSYREISSCSNFGDFQARRANIRFREGKGKTQFVHTLNGSGLAVGRTLIAIFENFQQEDGSIVIPKALRPYTKIDILKP